MMVDILDAFHRFYADTALFGAAAPLEAATAFFGVDRIRSPHRGRRRGARCGSRGCR
jgi:hypothetical protein